MSTVPDVVEREVLIDAPVHVVGSIVAEPEHIGEWPGDSAEIDLRPGGDATFTWDKHRSAHGQVERVEPPHHLSFRWTPRLRERGTRVEIDEQNSTLVEFQLSVEGDGTRLRVIESGFAALDGSPEENTEVAEDHRRGWAVELGELAAYAATPQGAARR